MPAVPEPPVVGAAPSAKSFKLPSVGEIRKALVGLSAVLGEALALGLLHGSAQHYATVGIGLVGAALTYLVPNKASA